MGQGVLIVDEIKAEQNSPSNKDIKLISDDLAACRAPEYQDAEDEGIKGIKIIHKSRNDHV